MPKVRTIRKPSGDVPVKNAGDDMIEELFENEKSVGFKAKNGGFPFKGKGAKEKASAQARALKTNADKLHNKKGVAGENTGSKARTAIAAARKRGSTTEDIARAIGRDDSTVSKIEAGLIKNPPMELVSRISKAKASSDKPTQKSTGKSTRPKPSEHA